MVGSLKELYEESVASQIKVWDDEIEHLDAKADILMAQIEDRYYNLITCLRHRENALQEHLAALKATAEDETGWLAARERMVRHIEEMKSALCHAAEQIELEVER